MHTLHTTDAFVLASYPHGESNRVYKLFTREHGLLYAHGQGVRELRNRNRYALRVAAYFSVTLVRGREVWRITSAREVSHDHSRLPIEARRVLSLLGRLLPLHEPSALVFDTLERLITPLRVVSEGRHLCEALTVIRVLDTLGYVGRPFLDPDIPFFLAIDMSDPFAVAEVGKREHSLMRAVNNALRGADG